ncbi:uncharacterized protein LOC127798971 [Diospyros lotus]|uniref:uncharacterized protein LOC127798971 n=1 Tax=Diospyros lotus TaxID=55363 RepID=UPI002253C93C|nr:uncharacterized protein LOC127798971 [Diospyros lotus]
MATVKSLWHEHPLDLRSVLSETKARCFVCSESLSGYNYRCPTCTFFIHISCLKLPLQSLHPLHPHHPLILLRHPPPAHHSGATPLHCTECKTPCLGFTYHCTACPFSLHLHCALQQRPFNLDIHNHPLTFFPSPFQCGLDPFRCSVCADPGNGFSLACRACDFVVHIECSRLPVKVISGRHWHPFSLVSVRSVDDGSGEFYCDIVCERRVNPRGCVYYCVECNYMAHLGCLVSAPKPRIKFSYEEFVAPAGNWKYKSDKGILPDPQMGDSDDDYLVQMRLRFSQVGSKPEGKTQLEHFSHQHPLVLSDDHEKARLVCRGCWGEIKGLAYICTQCNLFLHRWCAELPPTIRHPIHREHALTLLKEPQRSYDACKACDRPCDGFTFSCKQCGFDLHAMCASIPSIIRNGIHQHPLILSRKLPYSVTCNACGNTETSSGTFFGCEMCNLELDFACALLPHKIRHRCHVDPLALTHVPVPAEDESNEFYCDACEERRDPTHWVYHCADCDYSAHTSCVVSELLGGPPTQGPLQFNHHEHLLSLITNSPLNPC